MQVAITKLFRGKQLFTFIKSSSVIAFIFSLLLCTSIFMLFIGFQTTLDEAITLFVKTMLVTWIFIIGLKLGFTLLVYILERIRKIRFAFTGRKYRTIKIMSIAIITAVLLYSCQGQPLAGIS